MTSTQYSFQLWGSVSSWFLWVQQLLRLSWFCITLTVLRAVVAIWNLTPSIWDLPCVSSLLVLRPEESPHTPKAAWSAYFRNRLFTPELPLLTSVQVALLRSWFPGSFPTFIPCPLKGTAQLEWGENVLLWWWWTSNMATGFLHNASLLGHLFPQAVDSRGHSRMLVVYFFAVYYTISFIFLLKSLPHFDPCVRPVFEYIPTCKINIQHLSCTLSAWF